ncbi:DNA polymerase III, delta subunit [Alteribacillus persepolensis]|uniref:DNA polymerase III subunit delta n=1 Tax=Alteribacillus persepolensis TaxID=568899 RepID=A0A1G8CQ77_9BACI|nr:DNA polymerase III subunit delta [Alteribacillus persepolensis]SDH47040.1 DNA polymerase III, delta subunit [Alteribacillus persepolensis]
MDYLELTQQLQKGNVEPLYLLYGKEEFFIKNITEKIVSAVLTEEERDFNYSVYDMKETPVEMVVEEGETLPFFGEKRVILMKNSYFLTGVKDKDKIEHHLPSFEKYIEKPANETVIIVTVSQDKLDERKKVVKKLKKQGIVLEASPYDERKVHQWMDTYLHEKEMEMTKDAKELMVHRAGKDMMMLASEMDKLSLYVTNSNQITGEAVDKLVSRTLEDNVFELVDCVVRGRTEHALSIYFDLMKQNEEPIKLLVLLARQFRLIMHVQQLKKRGYTRQKIASQLKVHPFAVKVAEGQMNAFTNQMLASILKELAQADYEVKTGKMDKSLRVEMAITKIAAFYTDIQKTTR